MSHRWGAVSEIIVLSMSKEEFNGKNIKEVQKSFFHEELPGKNGRYQYRQKGLDAKANSLVLFRYDNYLIAGAMFLRREKYPAAKGNYSGELLFNPDTIATFRPISQKELNSVVLDFKGFSQGATYINPTYYHHLWESYFKGKLAFPSGNKKVLTNINSDQTLVDKVDKNYCLKRINYVEMKWNKVPVYYVNKDLMDKIYPPRKKKSLNLDCVREVLGSYHKASSNNEVEDVKRIESIWGQLSECITEVYSNRIAVGVYIKEIDQSICYNGMTLVDIPSIFICLERVNKWASDTYITHKRKSLKAIYSMIFAKVLFHELAHAYMDGNKRYKYTLPWGKIIEESLANAVSLSAFAAIEKPVIKHCMDEQPLEYRAYRYWSSLSNSNIKNHVKAWSKYYDAFNYLTDPIVYNLYDLYKKRNNYYCDINKIPGCYLSDRIEKYLQDSDYYWQKVAVLILDEMI